MRNLPQVNHCGAFRFGISREAELVLADVDPILIARCLVCAFFAAALIQSGFDKVFDWKGNLDWLNGHFAKTVFKTTVPLLLGVITVIEVMAGLACAASIIVLLLRGPSWIPIGALGLVGLNFTILFAGQRIAKDYAGAASLAGYFAVALLGLMLMSGL